MDPDSSRVPKQVVDHSASLVIRAFVEGPEARLLVRVVEVKPSGEDQLVGVTLSSAAASRIVGQWLDALAEGRAWRGPDDGNSPGRGQLTTS